MIGKLLIANRGEIASRVIRTAREMDIATVAVYSDPDARMPYVDEADEAVHLPGTAAGDTYLRVDAILAAAQLTGADAVHPGYGFLSENAAFARACGDAGLVFVGPSAEAIEAVGAKTAAKARMRAAGVPVLPGATIGPDDDLDGPPLARSAAEVGYPVLVKAAYGGGGRGMRIVAKEADLGDAVRSARREAASAFGDATVFLERYVERARHIEVQIFGDHHGTMVSLFERECSIQRRYQKVIEEAPSPAVDADLRATLGKAAIAAGQAIDYVGAGTVEFVMDQQGEFFFLEVNTRLQVEHPVTELVTGLDLVRLQLEVADGAPLPASVADARIEGHAIEARLYAEDVAAGYLPATGTLHRFRIPDEPGVRVDAGVRDGSTVGVDYDPMLAKVIAHGATRDEARRRLAHALAGATLHGVTTNRDLLVRVLREPEFAAGQIDTEYLQRHNLGTPDDPAGLRRKVHAVAAALVDQVRRRGQATVLPAVPSGWRNVDNADQVAAFVTPDGPVEVGYRFGRGRLRCRVDDVPVAVELHDATPDRIVLTVDGVRRSAEIHRVDDVVYVDSALGSTSMTDRPRFPQPGGTDVTGSLIAPMPGTVARVCVLVGDEVRAGAVVLALEAMKMEHVVIAPRAGTVTEVSAVVGDTVDAGAVLAVIVAAES